jgi:hypothetical protein
MCGPVAPGVALPPTPSSTSCEPRHRLTALDYGRTIRIVTEPSPTASDLSAAIAQLEAELRETRKNRTLNERAAASLRTTRLAVETADRDRDALTSPELENLRDRADSMVTRLRDTWSSIDRIRLNALTVVNSGVDLSSDPGIAGGTVLMAVLQTEAERRERATEQLIEVGLDSVRVPKPAQVEVPNERRKQMLAEALDEVVVGSAERARLARKPGRSGRGAGADGSR